MMAIGIICIVYIIACLTNKFNPSILAIIACIFITIFDDYTMADMMSGFTNDVILIVFGTDIFAVAFIRSGIVDLISRALLKISNNNERRLILLISIFSAAISSMLNNQVVSVIVIVICFSIARENRNMKLMNMTLPAVLASIIGGQLTLIGAPATLIASSMLETSIGQGFSMFEFTLLVMPALVFSLLFIHFKGYKIGEGLWDDREQRIDNYEIVSKLPDTKGKRKDMQVTVLAAVVMLFLFFSHLTSVGVAALIGGLICVLGGAVSCKDAYRNVTWDIIIWLACNISLVTALQNSGVVEYALKWLLGKTTWDVPFILIVVVIALVTLVISNFIANTTTVIIMIPIAISVADIYGANANAIAVLVCMMAGLAFLTPLSSGFLAMTMKAGYTYSDYFRYGLPLELICVVIITILIPVFYGPYI